MPLYYFLAILISLCFGSLPQTNQSFSQAALFTMLVVLAWWTLCYLAVRLVANLIDSGEVPAEIGFDWFDRQLDCFRWFSIALIALCLGGFGLGRNLDSLPYVQESLTIQSLILLSPALAMMCGLWASDYLFAARMGFSPHGLRRIVGSVARSLRSNVAWLLLPILGIMAVIDAVSLLRLFEGVPDWSHWIVLAVVVVVGLPLFVRRIFPTKPLDESTRAWIESIITSSGIGGVKIVLWDTGGRAHNAMLAGFFGRFRVLLLSDRLVNDLSRKELSMVILHEVAHAKRLHIPIRIAALVPAWLLGGSLDYLFSNSSLAQLDGLSWLSDWAGALGTIASLTATILLLRLVSYRSEYDADQVACRLAPMVAADVADVPNSDIEAGRTLASALLRVTEECPSARRSSWLHPGIGDRIESILPA